MIPLPLPPGGRKQLNRSHPQKPRPPRRAPPPLLLHRTAGGGEGRPRENTHGGHPPQPPNGHAPQKEGESPRGSEGLPASEEAEAEGGEARDTYGRKEPEGRTTASTKGAPGEKLPTASQTNPNKVTRHGDLGVQLKSRNRCNWETPLGVDT